MVSSATKPTRAPVPGYPEMLRRYQAWLKTKPSETAVEFFKQHGWSRAKFYEAVTYEEMQTIYNDWFRNDATGTQAAVFLRYGWSRNRFFAEATKRLNSA